MTAFGIDGTAATNRVTEHHGFPLPPDLPGRGEIQRDGKGRYLLPHPEKGLPVAYSRATTVADTLEDTYHLNMWRNRMVVQGLVNNPALAQEAARIVLAGAEKQPLQSVVDRAALAAGTKRSAEFGTAIHAWAGAVDAGQLVLADVPAQFQPHVGQYLRLLAARGLTPLPDWVERTVLHHHTGTDTFTAGTFDRLYRDADGVLVLGDLKTSASLTFSYLSYAIQLAIYAGAQHVLTLDGKGWEPMPPIRPEYAVLVHLPSDATTPDTLESACGVIPYSLAPGHEGLALALRARQMRSEARRTVPNNEVMPSPTGEYRRKCEARAALLSAPNPQAVAAVWEQYRDVWTDTLTELGHAVVGMLGRSAHVNASPHGMECQ